ncbi:MAG: hypothetical protein ACREIA_05705, partial [Opitutaceae bacterium]
MSVHETDIHVLAGGKAGREVVPRSAATTCEPQAKPFGNTLLLAESEPGLILDWELYQGVAPAEWRQAQESIQRQNQFDISEAIKALGSDRG